MTTTTSISDKQTNSVYAEDLKETETDKEIQVLPFFVSDISNPGENYYIHLDAVPKSGLLTDGLRNKSES